MVKSMKKKVLLIVEDNPLLAEMYKAAFERADIEVSVANNGKDGLALIKKEKPNLVLLDILMPEISGLEVLKELKKSGIKGIKVIVLTILSDEETRQKAEEFGIADYLIKSDLDLSEIVERVKKHL